jgi:A/G-specific adenine glycosylase
MTIQHLIRWSKDEFSQLPWRKGRTLYRTLVSEIMLQQTTVSTVKNHYHRFLERFPDLTDLARASEEEMLVAWKGLGYYRRARNLKKIAEVIVHEYGGKFPGKEEDLLMIPGIGPYTANALLAIGQDKKALAIDANLERVISRLYGLIEEKGPKLQKKIQTLFLENKIFPSADCSYRDLNEALMDLGRTYCQARKVSCELCPLKKECRGFKSKTPLKYPLEKTNLSTKAQEHEMKLLRIYVRRGGKLLVYKKSSEEWLSGQYEVPTFLISTTDEKLRQYPSLQKEILYPTQVFFKTSITKYKIHNIVMESDEKLLAQLWDKRQLEWRRMDDEQANFSTATLKGLSKI